jgi:hypothetical protein
MRLPNPDKSCDERLVRGCMKRLPPHRICVARRPVVLGCILLMVTGGPLFAQTTGSVNPGPDAAEPLVKDDPPPGGCMPIGVTVSGEVVFPFQCKEFIERLKAADQKAATPDQKPATAHEGPAPGQEPAVEEKTVAKQEDGVAPENSKPVDRPVKTAPIQKRVELEPREGIIGPPGCTRFRSYDAGSRTYRSYGGRRLSCQ